MVLEFHLAIPQLMRSLFFLVHERFTGMTSPSLESPLEGTATATSTLGYLSDLGGVSTMLPVPPGSSLTRYFVLYRALMAGLCVTDTAVRHACGQGREREM